jgi:4a-hydroxytetrahydrobiopterin dehydratase
MRQRLGLLLLLVVIAAAAAFLSSFPSLASATSSIISMSESAAPTAACSRDAQKHCVPCEGGLPAVPLERVQAVLPSLPLWKLSDDHKRLSRAFTAKSFAAALAFINAVGAVAEAEGHHPDLHLTSYREVEIVLYTHAVGGLTENDLIMAALIDAVPVVYSPKR